MKKPLIIIGVLLILGVLGLLTGLILFNHMLSATGNGSNEIEFTVEKGWTHSRVARELKNRGFVRNWFVYNGYVKIYRNEAKVYPGKYTINDGMSIDKIISVLNVSQTVRDLVVIIPEGKTSFEIAETILSKPLPVKDKEDVTVNLNFSTKRFINLINDKNFINELLSDKNVEMKNLEGLLFPSKHFIPENFDEKKIIKFLVNSFFTVLEQEVSPMSDIDNKLEGVKPLDFQQMLTLASLVEKETSLEEEKALVAGVYLNRVRTKGWVLNADPTIIYGLKLDGKWDTDLPTSLGKKSNGGINWKSFDSPYNTYTRGGLPPTAISNPGMNSIKASLVPKKTNYFFFVAKNDGSKGHYFAKSLAEHNRNISRSNHNGN